MRTSVEFSADVAKAVDQLRRDESIGVSEAVNTLIRRGLAAPSSQPTFRQRTKALGIRIDVSNVGAALDDLDGPTYR